MGYTMNGVEIVGAFIMMSIVALFWIINIFFPEKKQQGRDQGGYCIRRR